MALGLVGKIITGTGALAITSLGGIVLKKYLDSETIGKELQLQKKSLLEDSYEDWSKLISKYESANETTNPKKIKDWSLPTSQENQEGTRKSAFMEKCKELWNTKLRDIQDDTNKNRIKEELENWCVTSPKALNS